MSETVLVGSNATPVHIHGVHGGSGALTWSRFMTGNMMWSDLDSFEHVVVPPGVVIGEHVHSRTEEVYFVVRGRGEMRVGDEVREIGAGEAVLTPLHGRHSFRTVGDEPVELIVSEMLPPPITDVLPPHRPAEEA